MRAARGGAKDAADGAITMGGSRGCMCEGMAMAEGEDIGPVVVGVDFESLVEFDWLSERSSSSGGGRRLLREPTRDRGGAGFGDGAECTGAGDGDAVVTGLEEKSGPEGL
jgi:hypothetical protein